MPGWRRYRCRKPRSAGVARPMRLSWAMSSTHKVPPCPNTGASVHAACLAGLLLGLLAFPTVSRACPSDDRGGIQPAAAESLASDSTIASETTVRPEPTGWYAGDMHVHRSCGGSPVTLASIRSAMVAQDLDVVSLLADMGNGEVQNPATDLPQVDGQNDPISTSGRVIHWDAEWHWDATYSQYGHQALGGHIVALDLNEAHQIWDESTHPIFDWVHQQGGVAGFAHLQYLDEGFPQTLSCCTPIEYPVEVALGGADFISEDVNGGEAAIHAYYRLLNCGMRPGLAAGSDYPCQAAIGHLLTFAQPGVGSFDYHAWTQAIAHGRTVISRNARHEFLNLRVAGNATPGDQVDLTAPGGVQVVARWSSNQSLSRTIELVSNGEVVASKSASASSGAPDSLVATVSFPKSGWVCARVMGANGHEVHTAAVFVIVQGAPIRASAKDARFYVRWIESLIANTSPGGPWEWYFPTEWTAVQARYQAAMAIYEQVAEDAASACPCSIFEHDDAPQITDVTDNTPLELGVKFRTTVDGRVSAVRYFKGASNTGTHSGHIWSSTGALLAETVFAGETDSGWQQADFAAPVAVHAGTTYVASYHSPGYYSADEKYFALGLDSGPLRMLGDGEDGANGVYRYTATPAFPTDSFDGSNYWVDVVFTPDDLTPPEVSALSPPAASNGVRPDVVIGAVFDEPLDSTCVKATTFELRDAGGNLVPASTRYDAPDMRALLTPLAPLAESTTYTVRLHGGNAGCRIRDLAANSLAADVVWSFTTTRTGTLAVDLPPSRALRLAASPNPSRGPLNFSLESAASGYDALELLDVTGRVGRRLASGSTAPGRGNVRWDGRDDSGQRMPAGLYFARMRSRAGTAIVRVALIP